jgi:hypothetical protein
MAKAVVAMAQARAKVKAKNHNKFNQRESPAVRPGFFLA